MTAHYRVGLVMALAANKIGVTVPDILSTKRTAPIVRARHVAIYCCRKLFLYSYPELGRVFGNRDHSTMIHAANAIARKISADSGLNQIVEDIIESMLVVPEFRGFPQ